MKLDRTDRRILQTMQANARISNLELADAVIDACEDKVNFKFLYELDTPLRERVKRIAKEVYGADGVSFTPEAEAKAKRFEADPKFNDYTTMMVKTHLSLSHDPTKKGAPTGWIEAVDVEIAEQSEKLAVTGQPEIGVQFGACHRATNGRPGRR